MELTEQLYEALKSLNQWTVAEAEHFEEELPDDFIMDKVHSALAAYERHKAELKNNSQKTCDTCAHRIEGIYQSDCYNCSRYNADKWQPKEGN